MYHTLLFLNFGAPEVIVIGLIVVLLFGGKKIPELMKGLGKGVKSFKDGMKDGSASADDKPAAPAQQVANAAPEKTTIDVEAKHKS